MRRRLRGELPCPTTKPTSVRTGFAGKESKPFPRERTGLCRGQVPSWWQPLGTHEGSLGVQVGVTFPQSEIGADPKAIRYYAQAAEDLVPVGSPKPCLGRRRLEAECWRREQDGLRPVQALDGQRLVYGVRQHQTASHFPPHPPPLGAAGRVRIRRCSHLGAPVRW